MSEWIIRPAREEDIPILVQFRSAMFRDMGYMDEERMRALEASTLPYIQRALPAGEYRSWVAEADGVVIASAAFTYRQAAPSFYNLTGRQAYIASVYTLPGWRRKGIARAIMQTMLDVLQREGVPVATLTASAEGRPLYESMGFETMLEMRISL